MCEIYLRNDLRQIHIVTGDSIVKIDQKILTMNDPDTSRGDLQLRTSHIVLVPEDKQSLGRLARKIIV